MSPHSKQLRKTEKIMTIKTSHLVTIKDWTDYAAGQVEGVYPVPVKSDTIIDLAVFEASDHGATDCTVSLNNKYNSGYMGENMKYVEATIKNATLNVEGDDINTCTGTMNTYSIGKIGLKATERYSYNSIFERTAKTASELLVKLASDGVKGTVSFTFKTYPNGPKCHCNVIKSFSICL